MSRLRKCLAEIHAEQRAGGTCCDQYWRSRCYPRYNESCLGNNYRLCSDCIFLHMFPVSKLFRELKHE